MLNNYTTRKSKLNLYQKGLNKFTEKEIFLKLQKR